MVSMEEVLVSGGLNWKIIRLVVRFGLTKWFWCVIKFLHGNANMNFFGSGSNWCFILQQPREGSYFAGL